MNDVQPNVLSDDLVESNYVSNCESIFPPMNIKLNNGEETMKRRKIKAVIRFHTPSKAKEPEKFYHHLLMLYFPWQKEIDLLGDDNLYSTKFEESEVFSKVDANRRIFDDENAGNLVIDKSADIFAIENKVVPIKPILAKIKLNPGKRSSPEIERLAWACTIHKVQGLTLNKIVISFDLFKQRSFNYGQTYVALSHATSLQGFYVLGKLEHKHIKADPRVIEEYERLQNTSLLEENDSFQVQEHDTVIPIVLLNIRSLPKHSIDIKFDKKIFNCDILLFTETQLRTSVLDNDIQDHLYPFILNRQDSHDRYSNLAFCTKTTVNINEKEYFPVINGLMFTTVFTSRGNCEMRFLLLYRKQASNVQDFVNDLNHIVNLYTIDVILGDFNINYFDEKESQYLKNMRPDLGKRTLTISIKRLKKMDSERITNGYQKRLNGFPDNDFVRWRVQSIWAEVPTRGDICMC